MKEPKALSKSALLEFFKDAPHAPVGWQGDPGIKAKIETARRIGTEQRDAARELAKKNSHG